MALAIASTNLVYSIGRPGLGFPILRPMVQSPTANSSLSSTDYGCLIQRKHRHRIISSSSKKSPKKKTGLLLRIRNRKSFFSSSR